MLQRDALFPHFGLGGARQSHIEWYRSNCAAPLHYLDFLNQNVSMVFSLPHLGLNSRLLFGTRRKTIYCRRMTAVVKFIFEEISGANWIIARIDSLTELQSCILRNTLRNRILHGQ